MASAMHLGASASVPSSDERIAGICAQYQRNDGDMLAALVADAQKLSTAQAALTGYLDGNRIASLGPLIETISDLTPDLKDALGHQVWISISEGYERRLLAAVRSTSKATAHKASFDRANEVLAKAASIYAQYEDIVDVLDYAPLRLALRSVNVCALALFTDDIADAVYHELAGLRLPSLTRETLRALFLEAEWQSYVCRAAYRLVEAKVLNGYSSNTLDAHDPDESLPEVEVDFEQGILDDLHVWLQHSILPALQAWGVADLDRLQRQMAFRLHTSLGQLRARQLFDIISDFPQSSPALQDLISCSEQVDIKNYVSDQLSSALQARLLHPGASTRDIIQFYTHLIRSLRFVDPTGVILSHVIGPVRSYLRARSDTIPVIVASLLGQAGEFTLLRDLMRETADMSNLSRGGVGGNGANAVGTGGGVVTGDQSLTIYDDALPSASTDGFESGLHVDIAAMDESKRMVFIPEPDEDWAPRPVDAGPDYRQSRKSDVIAIIVSIFDDEEGFIAALERSCAEQIIQVRRYDATKEYETNENLKKRFGDASMGRCNVMLNDVKRSQRIDRRVHRLLNGKSSSTLEAVDPFFPSAAEALRDPIVLDEEAKGVLSTLHPLVLSRQFWPLLQDDDGSTAGGPGGGSVGGAMARVSGKGSNGGEGGQANGSMMFAGAPSGVATSSTPATVPIGSADGTANDDAKEQRLPKHYARAMEAYQQHFVKIVHGRKLRWLPGRNVVDVVVEMDDGRRIDERTTPLQAAVVQAAAGMAQGQGGAPSSLNVAELSESFAVSPAAVREACTFWVHRGILTEIAPESFAVVEQTPA